MAMAKQLLRQREFAIAEMAEHVGYSFVSAIGVTFTRLVGISAGRYAKDKVKAAAE